MALNKIEKLLEKYFDGETNVEEEKELQIYFRTADVAPHLKQYKAIFDYFSLAATQELNQKTQIKPKLQKKKRVKISLAIAASILVLLGVGTYVYVEKEAASQNLGTYDNPEEAMKETQKALAMLSNHVNVGIETVIVLKHYEDSKNLIFKP
jgi:hypothetical protein